MPKASPPDFTDYDALQTLRLHMIEGAAERVLAISTRYPDGYRVHEHEHRRGQLLHARTGVVLVSAANGRWIVPSDHAMWMPGGTEHAVEMIGDVDMHSVYVDPRSVAGLSGGPRVMSMTALMRCLVDEAVRIPADAEATTRRTLIHDLLVEEIGHLETQPLALPYPSDPRLAALCRRFVDRPDAHASPDDWAKAANMSRRSFTRHFSAETGLSFSAWRQQALLFAALPRLTAGEQVTTVAMDLGYDSVPAFTTMFRRFLGAPPRLWLGRGRTGTSGPVAGAQHKPT